MLDKLKESGLRVWRWYIRDYRRGSASREFISLAPFMLRLTWTIMIAIVVFGIMIQNCLEFLYLAIMIGIWYIVEKAVGWCDYLSDRALGRVKPKD
jgi:uncharacterized membrane protein